MNWIKDDRGQDVIEYALLAGFISTVAIAAILTIGPMVQDLYGRVVAAFNS